MDWAAIAAVCSIFTCLVVIVGVAYTYGALTTKVEQNAAQTVEHGKKLEKHEEKLGDHEVKIGRLAEWKDGFNAAASLQAHHEKG